MFKIDYREKKLLKYFEDPNNKVKYEVETLPVGDIWFVDNDKTILIFERKTNSDLVSSFRDGRYREQKNRLLQCDASYKGYLLEGTMFPSKDTPQIMGFVVNTILRDKLLVYRCATLSETYSFLKQIYNNYPKLDLESTEPLLKFNTGKAMTKREALTPDIVFQQQLCLIPGVSSTIAELIAEHFLDMKNLITQLEIDGSLISDLKTNKNHRLGEKLVENLKTYLKVS